MMLSSVCLNRVLFRPKSTTTTVHGLQNATCFIYFALSPTPTFNHRRSSSYPVSSSLAIQPETAEKPPSPERSKKKLYKAELTESVLRDYGFSDAHIAKLQTLRPRALTLDPHKILVPKFEFLRSIGVSPTDLPDIITLNPSILESSLKGRLIPSYNYLKTLNLKDRDIVKMMKNYWKFFQTDEEKIIGPKVEVLRSLGVPESAICLFLVHYTSVAHLSLENFQNCVDKAVEMGFNPKVGQFVQAVKALCRFQNQDIEPVMEIYQRWGFSDEDILTIFRTQPLCMDCSEKKIMSTMGFLINEMKWQPAAVVRWPTVLRYNLEKRIIPRCKVIQVLIRYHLVEENLSFGTFISISERLFLDRYVLNWSGVLPELISIYHGEEMD